MAIEYKATSELNRRALVGVGLSAGQAAIYEVLIQRGPLSATRLSFFSGVPRTLCYKYIEELIKSDLITKQEDLGKVAKFIPSHPLKLKELADLRFRETESSKAIVDRALPGLIRDFDTLTGTLPAADLYAKIAHYAGKACLQELNASEKSALQATIKDLSARLGA